MEDKLLSVGIDIGTSTTQVIFSELTVTNLASNYSVPRFSITDKKIIHKSSIYFTPLQSQTIIDYEGIKNILTEEYKKADISKENIDTGAVIITGETARKENAKEITEKLSGFAGDFVVATAGPDLESVISGKGAGADVFSKENSTVVANVDIGGGTSNISVFKRGNVIDTGCFDIGGRLIKVDKNSRKITYIAPKISEIIKSENISLDLGDTVSVEILKPVIDIMVKTLEESLTVKNGKYLNLLKTNKSISETEEIKYLSFSGGVAEYIYNNPKIEDWFEYGDIGIVLGQAIKKSSLFNKFDVIKSAETIRATVVGAGNHTTELSGSTITYVKEMLPLKNIPVIKILNEDFNDTDKLKNSLDKKISWFTEENENQNIALAFEGKINPTFNEINSLAQKIINVSSESQKLLIIITEKDMAKALGQSLITKYRGTKQVICIDNIYLNDGDYIDIGQPVAENTVVPVVVKTLIFG